MKRMLKKQELSLKYTALHLIKANNTHSYILMDILNSLSLHLGSTSSTIAYATHPPNTTT